MPKQLLMVAHSPSENTRRLRQAALEGASHPDIGGVEVILRAPLEATAQDVIAASAVLIGTTENFGYMAGLTKDFFERIYYPSLERTQGKPIALYIRAGNDGTGTLNSIDKILLGLRWKHVAEPLICKGDWDDRFLEQVEELAMTLAAGVEAGVY